MPSPSFPGLDLVSAPRDGKRPASFWRFAGAPPPGTGRTPVLAVAGLGLDGRVFSRLAPLAADRDLVLVNLPNDLPPAPTMGEVAAEALAALDAAGHGGRPAVVLGSSFGGMVALALALDAPGRAAGLVLVGTAPSWSSVPARLRLAARLHGAIPRRAYPRVFAAVMLPPLRGTPPERREELRVQMLHRTKGFLGSSLAAMRGFDARGRLGEVRAPALVVHGLSDHVFGPATGEALAGGIPGARLVALPGCGHLPQVSHADALLGALREFLAEAGL